MDFLASQLKDFDDNEQIRVVEDLLGNTDVYTFVYYPAKKTVVFSDKTADSFGFRSTWENVPETLSKLVHPVDRRACYGLFHKIDEGVESASAELRAIDMEHCSRLSMVPVKKDGETELAIGLFEDITESYRNEKLAKRIRKAFEASVGNADGIDGDCGNLASVLGSQYHAIFHIRMKEGTCTCLQDDISGDYKIGATFDYRETLKSYIENHVDSSDRSAVRAFANFATLSDRLRHLGALSLDFRRSGFGWTRGQFLIAQHDESGMPTHVMFLLSDANAEMQRKKIEDQALYDLNHDELTGTFNRKAFDEMVDSTELEDTPIGFALIDIDNFKSYNEAYGKESGDEVLKIVAEQLKACFRAEDSVFRISGDEFGILLHNSDSTCWEPLCDKLKAVHSRLEVRLPNKNITLSAGVCFSKAGLKEWMFSSADTGLYHTKNNGRAGCTLANQQGALVLTWQDDSVAARQTTGPSSSNTGFCRIEVPTGSDDSPRMVCGETARELFGISREASPEECFDLWREGFDSSQVEMLRKARVEMLTSGDAECTYHWIHPQRGKLLFKMTGSGEIVDGVEIFRGLHTLLQSAQTRTAKTEEKSNDLSDLATALSSIYFTTVYIDIDNDSLDSLKAGDTSGKGLASSGIRASEGLFMFSNKFTQTDFRQAVLDFVDLSTLPSRIAGKERIDLEFPSNTDKGWCRASWFPIRRNAEGRLTHVLFAVASVDSEKRRKIERDNTTNDLVSLHYEAARSLLETRILSVALIDKKTHETDVWTRESGFVQTDPVDFADVIRKEMDAVSEADRESFVEGLDLDQIASMVEYGGRYSMPFDGKTEKGDRVHLKCHFSPHEQNGDFIMLVIEGTEADF